MVERTGADLWMTGGVSAEGGEGVSGGEISLGTVLCGRYELRSLLGRGGMGSVFLVFDRLRGREIALKMLLEVGGDRLLEELGCLERLSHDGIVRTYDLGFAEELGRYFFTMERIEGESLSEVFSRGEQEGRRPAMGLDQIRVFLLGLLDALGYAHRRGVVHRDLKPSNIMLLAGGGVKLLDFGIAKALDVGAKHTKTVGTAFYMAPEQLKGGQEVTAAADIYAVGVLLYQLLTGEVFYGRMPGPAGYFEQLGLEAPFPVGLDGVLLRALDAAPGRRYQEVETLGEAFALALGSVSLDRSKEFGGKGGDLGGVDEELEVVGEGSEEEFLDLGGLQTRGAHLVSFAGREGVTRLELSRTRLEDRELAPIVSFRRCWWLNLEATGVGEEGMRYVGELGGLRTLLLSRTRVDDAALAHVSGLKKLEELDLSGTLVGDRGLLSLSGLGALRTLKLGGLFVSDEGLGVLGSLSSLRSLDLSGTSLTDGCWRVLCKLEALERLDLSGTGLGDVGLRYLGNLQGLRKLVLMRTQVSQQGFRWVKQVLPDCEVLWGA